MTTLTIYNYSVLDQSYTAPGFADPNPLVPGEFLIPANATAIVPPNAITDTIPRFDAQNQTWSLVPDFRGTVYWMQDENGKYKQHVIRNIDELVPNNAVMTEPTYNPSQPTSEDVNRERDRRIRQGALLLAGDYSAPIQVDGSPETMSNMLNRKNVADEYIQAGLLTQPMIWRDDNNVNHILTPLQMKALWLSGVAYVDIIYMASWALKTNPDGSPKVIVADYKDDMRWPNPDTTQVGWDIFQSS